MELKQLIEVAGDLRTGIEAVEAKTGHHHSALAFAISAQRELNRAGEEIEAMEKLKKLGEGPGEAKAETTKAES